MKRFEPGVKIEAYNRAIDALRASEDGTEWGHEKIAEQERCFRWLADKLELEVTKWYSNLSTDKVK